MNTSDVKPCFRLTKENTHDDVAPLRHKNDSQLISAPWSVLVSCAVCDHRDVSEASFAASCLVFAFTFVHALAETFFIDLALVGRIHWSALDLVNGCSERCGLLGPVRLSEGKVGGDEVTTWLDACQIGFCSCLFCLSLLLVILCREKGLLCFSKPLLQRHQRTLQRAFFALQCAHAAVVSCLQCLLGGHRLRLLDHGITTDGLQCCNHRGACV
mmetsp:Transcript_116913/g.214937  ORF Transcript_116913/g.214937 Transcript_116913/m.214937 type:complete len:214 (-) Transcript_116913:1762-2403(-)